MSPLPLGAIYLIISDSFLCTIATVSVGLRFLSIHRLKRSIRLHDWLTVVALVCVYGDATSGITGATTAGYGLPVGEVTANGSAQSKNTPKIFFFIASIFWWVGTLTFRSAILMLYLDLFGSSRTFKYCCYMLQAVVVLVFLSALITILRICTPVERNWNNSIKGSCGDGNAALVASATIAAILDIMTVALPLPIVWRLQMAAQKKVAITATFALGLSICGINFARLASNELCNSNIDFKYCASYSLIFTLSEMAGGILVAGVPTLGPVFFPKRYRPTENGNSSWQHLDSDGTGEKSRISRATANNQEVLSDDCELLGFDQNIARNEAEPSSD